MKDDNTWLLILLAAGVVLYLVMKNKTTSSVSTQSAQPSGYLMAGAVQNPLAGTNVQPAVAPATQNAMANANAQTQGAGSVGSYVFSYGPSAYYAAPDVGSGPFSFGPSGTVVAPNPISTDLSSADASESGGGHYQPGHGPALIL